MRTAGWMLLFATGLHAGDGIEWAKDLEDAKARSLRSGRPVLAYFTFDT